METVHYMDTLKIKKFRDVFIRFRLGINELNINRRYERTRSLFCPFCPNCLENEVHFLMDCPLYDDIRRKYLWTYLLKCRTIECLIDGKNAVMTRQVAMCIYYAFKRRNENVNL